jgi:hypothetical protein
VATSWHALFLALWFAVCLCVSADAAEPTPQVLGIVTATQDESTSAIVAGLRKRFPAAQHLSPAQLAPLRRPDAVYLAVGPAALRATLAAEVEGVTISLFSANWAYHDIVETLPPSRRDRVTAIYADPAPVDQFRLVRAIYRKPVTVAVLLTDKTHHLVPTLKDAAVASDVDITIETLGVNEPLNRALNRIAGAPVLLAMPDSTIYNNDTLRNILITTYRHDRSVIGFSSSLVKAGALATTYSEIDDIAEQAQEVISEFVTSGRLPAAQFPKYFDVVVNDSVAHSLNLVVSEEAKQLSRQPPRKPQ